MTATTLAGPRYRSRSEFQSTTSEYTTAIPSLVVRSHWSSRNGSIALLMPSPSSGRSRAGAARRKRHNTPRLGSATQACQQPPAEKEGLGQLRESADVAVLRRAQD